MTIQLNATQKRELTELMRSIGFDLKPVKVKITGDMWAKRHAARMAKTWKHIEKHGLWKDAKGVTSYQVRGLDGNWYSDGHPNFARAKAERELEDAALCEQLHIRHNITRKAA